MEELLQDLWGLSRTLMADLPNRNLEAMEVYMEERARLFALLQEHRPTPEQAELLRTKVDEILAMDRAIVERMQTLRMEAETKTRKTSEGRQAMNLYNEDFIGEKSVFFDSKR